MIYIDNFQVNNKVTGEKSMSRHYLSPERKVLKTGLAVIEYLRYDYLSGH